MRAVKQSLRHSPETGVYGDCHRAALASVLELDLQQVPHFAASGPDGMHERVRDWLISRGLIDLSIPIGGGNLADCLQMLATHVPSIPVLFGGTSRNGCGHTVVVMNGQIVHDPALDESGIVGPMEDGYFWLTIISPLHIATVARDLRKVLA